MSSTQRWNDVPRGTMDEVSSHVRLDPPIAYRQGRLKDRSTLSSNPMMEGLTILDLSGKHERRSSRAHALQNEICRNNARSHLAE